MEHALSSIAGALLIVVLIVAALMLYPLPSWIAVMRGARNVGSIVVINLLLGWLFIPWVIALAMSFSDPRHND